MTTPDQPCPCSPQDSCPHLDPGIRTTVQRARGTVILAVDGEIDLATALALEVELLSVLRSGPRGLLLDLSAVAFIDCSGLNVLLRSRATATRLGIEFRLCKISRPVSRLLSLTIGRQPAPLAANAVNTGHAAATRTEPVGGNDALWWQAPTVVPLTRRPYQVNHRPRGSRPPAPHPRIDTAAHARVYPLARHLSAQTPPTHDRAAAVARSGAGSAWTAYRPA